MTRHAFTRPGGVQGTVWHRIIVAMYYATWIMWGWVCAEGDTALTSPARFAPARDLPDNGLNDNFCVDMFVPVRGALAA